MREIKFQVLLDNKVVGYERLNESGWQWMWMELNPNNHERWVTGVITGSSSVLVRRMFTGLKDNNGKEVYEGDIIKIYLKDECPLTKPGEIISEVKWYGIQGNCWGFTTPHGWLMFHLKYYRTIKIIGNIYENPELLK